MKIFTLPYLFIRPWIKKGWYPLIPVPVPSSDLKWTPVHAAGMTLYSFNLK